VNANDKVTGKLMLWLGWSNIAGACILEDIGISGLVVEHFVAIDVNRARFPADEFCVFCVCGLVGIASQPTQDHILLWSWRQQMWHQFYDNGLPALTGPFDRGKANVLFYVSKMSFVTPRTNA
jgi:hypothetical protein